MIALDCFKRIYRTCFIFVYMTGICCSDRLGNFAKSSMAGLGVAAAAAVAEEPDGGEGSEGGASAWVEVRVSIVVMAEREAWAFEFVILGLGALCWTCLLVYFVWNRYLDERRMHWANLGIGAEEEGPAAKGTKAKRG